jgi:hypothetical protein
VCVGNYFPIFSILKITIFCFIFKRTSKKVGSCSFRTAKIVLTTTFMIDFTIFLKKSWQISQISASHPNHHDPAYSIRKYLPTTYRLSTLNENICQFFCCFVVEVFFLLLDEQSFNSKKNVLNKFS